MSDERILRLDMNTDGWAIPEVRAYRKAVGVNPDYAGETIDRAFKAADAESREAYGELVDEKGWSPPDGWVPLAVLNIDPDYLLGFYWITARRQDPSLDYDAFVEGVRYGEVLESFWSTLKTLAEERQAQLPLANRAERRKSGQRKGTSSASATSSAGRRATSTPSPSASSAPPSSTAKAG